MKKIKKMAAVVLAAVMILAMGVTVFAADTLSSYADGSYTADVNLYKESSCTNLSMGDDALNDVEAEFAMEDGSATLVLHTHELTYMLLTGHLSELVLTINGTEYTGTLDDDGEISSGDYIGKTDYKFTFSGIPASDLELAQDEDGEDYFVIEGSFTVKVSIMPISSTGYLKFTSINGK